MRKIASFCAFVFAVSALCGCSMQEVDDRQPVAAAAIERGETIALTAQTVTVSSDDTAPKTELSTIEADSIRQGIDRGGDATYWTTAETILLDEPMAQTDIFGTIDQLTQEQTVRPSVRLCVTEQGECVDILSSEDSADGLQTILDDGIRNGQAVDMPLYKAKNIAGTDGIDLVFPVLGMDGDSARLSGTALFSGEELSGRLDEEQTAILTVLRNDTDRTVLYDADGSRYELIDICTDIETDSDKNGEPRARITVTAKLKASSEAQAKGTAILLKQRGEALADELKECGCDALGLGQEWYRSAPKDFESSDWRREYAELDLSIRVRIEQTQGGETR